MQTKSITKEQLETKIAEVHMLPTKGKSNIYVNNKGILTYNEHPNFGSLGWKPQHLYITTEDEIKEGDWCIEFDDEKWQHLYQPINTKWDMVSKANYCRKRGTVRKIIATTDKSLCIEQEAAGKNIWVTFLPQPSQPFVELYVKLGDIYKVLVECYSENFIDECTGNIIEKGDIKVDSHNTITIHLIK